MPPALPARPFLYPIVDLAFLGGRSPVQAVEALARGGVQVVQLRAKALEDRRLLETACATVAAAHAQGVLLIVNDRPDVARMAGADGVHVGQEDLPPAACRRVVGPDALIGFSTHRADQLEAARAEPLDYVAVGPVFPTRSKASPDPVVGLELVRRARALTRGTLVAIGGITPENASAVVEAGADGLAVLSALLEADDLAEAARRFAPALGCPR